MLLACTIFRVNEEKYINVMVLKLFLSRNYKFLLIIQCYINFMITDKI